MQADLFILNYNGDPYVLSCVASMLEAVRNSLHRCQVIVIDNQSTDGSRELIRNHYPTVPIWDMENRVLCSFNEAVSRSDAEVVFLLNNDLTADCLFIDPILSVFEEENDAFLVAAKSFLLDGSYEGGKCIPYVSFGNFATTCRFKNFARHINDFGFTFSAGFGAFDRRKFLELGGFDDLYLPGRMEDADLAFRAWKKGWKSYYQPRSILYHAGARSFKGRFGVRGTMEIAHRNTFLFIWKHFDAPKLLFEHLFFLFPRMMWMILRGRFEWAAALWKAFFRLPEALSRRRKEMKTVYRYSNEEVLSFFKNGY